MDPSILDSKNKIVKYDAHMCAGSTSTVNTTSKKLLILTHLNLMHTVQYMENINLTMIIQF